MKIKVISEYTKGKTPMAQIVIIKDGYSYTRHAQIVKDGYLAYWPVDSCWHNATLTTLHAS